MTVDKPTIARVYDCFLGGKDNFAVDHQVYKAIAQIAPEAPELAREGRRFLGRGITHLAASGIDQFLDLGCGFPTSDNIHDIVGRVNRGAVTVYVDNDPTVAAHARALLAGDPNAYFALGDLRDPTSVLEHYTVAGVLDFSRPIALVQAATLHHLDDSEAPEAIQRAYTDALPPGSMVLLTHFHNPADASPAAILANEVERRFRSTLGTGRFRTLSEIEVLLEGLTLLPSSPLPDAPSIVPVREWWPCGPPLPHTAAAPMDKLFVGALGAKPGATEEHHA